MVLKNLFCFKFEIKPINKNKSELVSAAYITTSRYKEKERNVVASDFFIIRSNSHKKCGP